DQRTDERVGLPTMEVEKGIEQAGDHESVCRGTGICVRPLTCSALRVHGAQCVIARRELAPALFDIGHELLAAGQVEEYVGLALRPGQHPAVPAGYPLHRGARHVSEFSCRRGGRDAVEATPFVEN